MYLAFILTFLSLVLAYLRFIFDREFSDLWCTKPYKSLAMNITIVYYLIYWSDISDAGSFSPNFYAHRNFNILLQISLIVLQTTKIGLSYLLLPFPLVRKLSTSLPLIHIFRHYIYFCSMSPLVPC